MSRELEELPGVIQILILSYLCVKEIYVSIGITSKLLNSLVSEGQLVRELTERELKTYKEYPSLIGEKSMESVACIPSRKHISKMESSAALRYLQALGHRKNNFCTIMLGSGIIYKYIYKSKISELNTENIGHSILHSFNAISMVTHNLGLPPESIVTGMLAPVLDIYSLRSLITNIYGESGKFWSDHFTRKLVLGKDTGIGSFLKKEKNFHMLERYYIERGVGENIGSQLAADSMHEMLAHVLNSECILGKQREIKEVAGCGVRVDLEDINYLADPYVFSINELVFPLPTKKELFIEPLWNMQTFVLFAHDINSENIYTQLFTLNSFSGVSSFENCTEAIIRHPERYPGIYSSSIPALCTQTDPRARGNTGYDYIEFNNHLGVYKELRVIGIYKLKPPIPKAEEIRITFTQRFSGRFLSMKVIDKFTEIFPYDGWQRELKSYKEFDPQLIYLPRLLSFGDIVRVKTYLCPQTNIPLNKI